MIFLTAPMVKKLDQLIAGGGGGGGTTDLTPVLDAIAAIPGGSGSTDLTPVLNAIAAIPAPTGGNVDLTPVLNAVAAVDSKAVALQSSVEAIPGGGGGSTDLTPVLDAIAAIPGGGGSTDLTPVLDAIAALPAPGAAGSPIKSIQRLAISTTTIPINSFVDIAIAPVEPSKTAVVMLQQTNFVAAYAKYSVESNALRLINTSTQYAVTGVLMKLEIIEYV